MKFYIKFNLNFLLLLLFFLYSFFYVIDLSLFNTFQLNNVVQMILFVFLIIIFFGKNLSYLKNIKYFTISVLILIIFLISAVVTKRLYLINYALFIINGMTVDFRKIVNSSFWGTLIATLTVVVASKMGILSDLVYITGGRISHSFGFSYFSHLSFLVFYLFLNYLFLRGKSITYFEIIGLFAIDYLVYSTTTNRLSHYLGIFVLLMFVLAIKLNWIKFKSYFFKIFSLYSYSVGLLLSIYIANNYDPGEVIWRNLNHLLSNRLGFQKIAFALYQPQLFGNDIQMVGNYEIEILNRIVTENSFYLDSGFLYSWLGYGILFTTLLIILYTSIFYKAYKNKDKAIYIWCMAIFFFSFINNTWVNITYNPLLFMLGGSLLASNVRYEKQ